MRQVPDTSGGIEAPLPGPPCRGEMMMMMMMMMMKPFFKCHKILVHYSTNWGH